MLKDCKAGDRFDGVLLVNEWKEVPFRQKAGAYLSLNCQDNSGTTQGKMWNYEPRVIEWLKQQDIFRVKGVASEYRGVLDLTVESIRMIPPEEVNLSDLLPVSPVGSEELEERLQFLADQVKQPALKELLEQILSHPVHGPAFRMAPAALKIHHPYLHGLWEHSVSVAEAAGAMAGHYPQMDRDLVITGALLHDFGKTLEYSYSRGNKMTTEGRLLGHIVLGLDILREKIDKIPDFPQDLRLKLLHILVSHHGKYEWQSPKKPKFREALAVHYADLMDAEMFHFTRAKEDQPEAEWSAYVPSMERYLYLM